MDAQTGIDAIVDDFEVLEDWEDRYRYLIELGNGLAPLEDDERSAETKVRGCASQVWIVRDTGPGKDPVLVFRGDSDAHIVRGLIAVVLALFSGRRASEIVKTDEHALFERLHLAEHITPQRSNGLRSMVARIKADAATALAGTQVQGTGR